MKLQIRQGLFETNSSSVHSLTMCTLKDYSDFKNGKKFWHQWEERLVDEKDAHSLSYVEYEERCNDYERFCQEFFTPNGESVIAFGFYGNEY